MKQHKTKPIVIKIADVDIFFIGSIQMPQERTGWQVEESLGNTGIGEVMTEPPSCSGEGK